MASEVLNPTIYDPSGKPLSLPEGDIHESIASGKVGFQKGIDVPVLDPNGTPGTIPSEQAQDAFNNGYTFDLPSAQHERFKAQEFSGALPSAMAAATGALRGMSIGLSDQALTKLGIMSPAQLSDLRKYQPGWSLTGEAAGILADPLGAASAVGQIGKAVTAATDVKALAGAGRLLEATGLSESPTAAKALAAATDIGSHAVGSAVEGALYAGVGNTITEQALGDPDLNAEKVLSNVGYGALFGGALGGAFKSLEIGLPPAVKGATDALAAVKNKLIGTGIDDAGVLEKAIPPGKFLDAIKNRAINLDTDEGIRLVKDVTTDLNDANKNIQTMLKEVNKDIRPKEAQALINSPEISLEEIKSSYHYHLDQLNKAIETMRNEPELYPGGVARKLELERDAFIRDVGEKKSDYYSKLVDLKQGLQKNINFSKLPTAQEADAQNLLNSLRGDVRDTLRNPLIFGDAGARLAAHDDMLHQFFEFLPPGGKMTDFQKAFMKRVGGGPGGRWEFDPQKVERVFKRGNTLTGQQNMALLEKYYGLLHDLPKHVQDIYENVPNARFDPSELSGIIDKSEKSVLEGHQKYLSSLNNSKNSLGLGDAAAGALLLHHPLISAAIEAYQFARNPIQQMNKLALIERMAGKATNLIGKAAKAVFDPSIKTLEKHQNMFIKLPMEKRRDMNNDLTKKIQDFSANPNSLVDFVSKNTEILQDHAPGTAQAMQKTMIAATQFLSSKLPIAPKMSPFEEPYKPSDAEIAKFERYLAVVEHPLVAMAQVKDGTITPDTIETLTAVYPKLYETMKGELLTQASHMLAKKEKIPYQIRQSIGFFLGQSIDSSMEPQAILANQMSYVPKNIPQQMQTKPSKSGMQKMTLAERTGVERDREKA